ncbi:MAG: HEAT repeat domain-containing protein, partial [Planctomycetota bacterium]
MRCRLGIVFCTCTVVLVLALPWGTGLRIRGGKQEAIQDAVESLGSLRFEERERATRFLVSLGESSREALTEALGSDDPEVRMRATFALLELDLAREAPEARRDREFRRIIRMGLEEAGELRPGTSRHTVLSMDPGRAATAAVSVARSVEGRPLPHQRVVMLLRDLERPEGAPYVATLLERGGFLPSTLHHAAECLRTCGGPGEVEALRNGVRSADPFSRRHALRALASIGGCAQYPIVRAAARDPDRYVRAEATRALGPLGGNEAGPLLSAMARDPEPRVRVAALDGLGSLPGRRAREAALRALSDRAAEVRATAVLLVAARGENGDAGLLREFLRDPSPLVRGAAVRALGMLGSLENAVRAGVRDESPAVRRVALQSARRLS